MICLNCNKEFTPVKSNQKFCCKKCRKHYNNIDYHNRNGSKPERKEQIKKAMDKFRNKPDYKEYCNKKSKEYFIKKPKYSPVYFLICKATGRLFTAKRKNAKYCKEYYKSEQYKESCRSSVRIIYNKYCTICGNEFTYNYGSYQSFCSDECFKESIRNIRRRRRHKERIRNKLATIETVNYIKVFERDKWICQSCGIKTPKKLRSTYYDNAPELDHIIPLSKGGSHSYSNVRCLCRKCNSIKSNKLEGQLLLCI